MKPNLRAIAYGAALGELYAIVAAAGGRPETAPGAPGLAPSASTASPGAMAASAASSTRGAIPNRREKMGHALVEGLGTLPPALARRAGSLGLGEGELPLLHHLDAVLRGERAAGGSLADLLRLKE